MSATVLIVTGVVSAATAATPHTYQVTAGSHKTGSVSVVGKTHGGTAAAPAITLTDTRTNTSVGCVSGTARGTVRLGQVHAARIATVRKTSFRKCTAFGGAVALSPKQVGKWYVNGVGKTKHGVTRVSLSHVKETLSSSSCSVTLSGSADGKYNNATKRLAVAPRTGSGRSLKASHVSGCGGVIANHDTVTFVARYKLATPKGAIRIS